MAHELFNQPVQDWKPLNGVAQPEIKENDLLQRILQHQDSIEESDYEPETPEPHNEPDGGGMGEDTADHSGQPVDPYSEPDNPNKGTVAGLFTPESAINLFDVVMSRLGALGMRYMDYNIGVNDLKLTAGEKSTIRPHLYEVLKRMNLVSDNPYVVFLIAAGSIYGAKILEAQSNIPPAEKKKNVSAAKSAAENIDSVKKSPPRDANGHFIRTKETNGTEIKRPVGRPRKS